MQGEGVQRKAKSRHWGIAEDDLEGGSGAARCNDGLTVFFGKVIFAIRKKYSLIRYSKKIKKSWPAGANDTSTCRERAAKIACVGESAGR